jgi:hypothetical protein
MDLVVPSTELTEFITVAPEQIIYQRRARVVALAEELGNVSEACRVMGVSRKSFHQWRAAAQAHGLDALMPKTRRRPQEPNATPTHVIEELLTMAVLTHDRLSSIRRPSRRSGLRAVEVGGPETARRARLGATRPARGESRRHHRHDDGAGDRGRP